MSIALERYYLNKVKNRLEHFKDIGAGKYNFRCPFCHDSKISKIKARGYLGEKSNSNTHLYHCFNCGVSFNFSQFLSNLDENLYRSFIIELMQEKRILNSNIFQEKISEKKNNILPETFKSIINNKKEIDSKEKDIFFSTNYLTSINQLPLENICKQYVISRKIPEKFWDSIYYCSDFMKFTNHLVPGKFKTIYKDEPRLVIPYKDCSGKVFAYVGRSLETNPKTRYYTIKIYENAPKIFGLDKVDPKRTILCTEGAIDSMFLPNAIAVSGSSYDSPLLEKLKDKIIIVGDNERRNREVCQLINKMLMKGFKCVLWRENLGFKDINEAILKGYTVNDILQIIKEDAVSGDVGIIKYHMWKMF